MTVLPSKSPRVIMSSAAMISSPLVSMYSTVVRLPSSSFTSARLSLRLRKSIDDSDTSLFLSPKKTISLYLPVVPPNLPFFPLALPTPQLPHFLLVLPAVPLDLHPVVNSILVSRHVFHIGKALATQVAGEVADAEVDSNTVPVQVKLPLKLLSAICTRKAVSLM